MTAFVVVLACSEPGAGDGLEAFLCETYAGARREDVLLPGGPWWAARLQPAGGSKITKWLTAGARHRVADGLHRWIERKDALAIEVIAHEGCGWYEREFAELSPGERVRRQGEDVVAAVNTARGVVRLPVRGRYINGAGACTTIV